MPYSKLPVLKGSMLYGLRRRPERLDRHPSVRAELTALGFSWEVPKKGPRGPRKRKTAADPLSCMSGVGDESTEDSVVIVEGFETGAPREMAGNDSRGPLSVRLSRPRPMPPSPRSRPEITVMTAVSAGEGHRTSVARPEAIVRNGVLNNTDASAVTDLEPEIQGYSELGGDNSARISTAEPRRIRPGKDQGGGRRNKGLLTPAARWLLEEGGSFLGAGKGRRTVSKGRPAGGTGSSR